MSFFNYHWKLKFEHVQTFHFLMNAFFFEFKGTLLKCIGIELASDFLYDRVQNKKYTFWETSISQDKNKVDIKKGKMETIKKSRN